MEARTESPTPGQGSAKLRRQSNIGLVVVLALVAFAVVAVKYDAKYWFESREQRIERLERAEGSASLLLWYCEHQGGACAKQQAELDVAREKLRDAYR